MMANQVSDGDKFATVLVVLSMNLELGDYDGASVWIVWSKYTDDEDLYDHHPLACQVTPKLDSMTAKSISSSLERALRSQGYVTRLEMEDDL